MLTGAWAVLLARHSRVAAEVAAAIRVITPLAMPSGRSQSSSSPEVFGTVAMSLPADPVCGAEALAHEIQHVKLGALLDQVQLTLDDDGSRYYAPWRPDPRPPRWPVAGRLRVPGGERVLATPAMAAGIPRTWGCRVREVACRRRVGRGDPPVERSPHRGRAGVRRGHGTYPCGMAARVRLRDGPGERRARRQRAPGSLAVGARRPHTRVTGGGTSTSRSGQMGGGSKSKSSRLPATTATASGCAAPRVLV